MQAPGRTRIQLCGRLVVELEGRRLEESLPSRQGRLLFAYLALNSDRAVRRDELIDCIWPERRPADPSAALNTLVSRVRSSLGASAIAGRGSLALSLPPDAEIDVRVAVDALARAHAAAADQDWQAAWGPARASLAIAERGLLPGLEAPWIDERRRDLEELELQALELVAESGLGLGGGELAAAERGATKLVARAPLRETGYGLHMRVLAARGNVAEALQAFEELRQLLREELGTVPSPALLALHRRLLAGDVAEVTPDVRESSAAAASRTDDGDFVGRGRELEVLERALTDAHNGRRRLALIGGEPGIGKTRLAEELAARAAAAGGPVVWGRCSEGHGAPPFWPWVEVVRALTERSTPSQVRRALGSGGVDLVRIVPELDELFPGLEPAQILDPEAARFRLYDSLARFLVRLSARQSLVLVLDDLQWADVPSLQLLRFLASRGDEARMLIVGLYRTTDVTDSTPLADALAAVAGDRHVDRLELTGLSRDELADLVSRASAGEVSGHVADSLHHRTDGNPFYASQLVRMLESEGALGAAAAEHVIGKAVPSGVSAVIRRRMDVLPTMTTELLTGASVVGEEFELDLVARLAALDDEAALDLLDHACRQHIVSESPTAIGRFRFSHALVRETLYGELAAVRRSLLHGRVAKALEELHGDDDDRVVELAHHFYEAAPTGAAVAAHAYAVRAADLAASRLAYEQAEHQLRRALEVLDRFASGPERSERELDLQLRLGALLMMTRGYADAEVGAACARARALCGDVGDPPQLVSALWRLGVFYEVRADFAISKEIGEELLELGRHPSRRAFVLAGSQIAGAVALHGGRLGTASEYLLEAQALADELEGLVGIFGMDFRVTSRAFLGWAHSLRGDASGANLSADALELARRLTNPHDEAFALFIDALCAVIRRDVDRAALQADAGVALCSARGFRLFGATTTIIRGWAVAENGDPVSGVAAIRDGLAAFKATGARMMLHLFLALLAQAECRAGRLDEALAATERGLSHVDPTNRFYEAEIHRVKGELLGAMPRRVAEAEPSLRKAVLVAREQDARTLELRAEASLRTMVPAGA